MQKNEKKLKTSKINFKKWDQKLGPQIGPIQCKISMKILKL